MTSTAHASLLSIHLDRPSTALFAAASSRAAQSGSDMSDKPNQETVACPMTRKERREHAVHLYVGSHLSLREVHLATGYSIPMVRRALAAANIPPRPRGGPRNIKTKRPNLSDAQVRCLQCELQKGYAMKTACRALRLPYRVARRSFEALGIVWRRPKQQKA